MLYHYTSLETLLAILEGLTVHNGEYYLHLRATRIDKLNDPAGINDVTTKENLTIYNLQGNRIGTFTRAEFEEMITTKRFPQGVYVVNGKKMMMKL